MRAHSILVASLACGFWPRPAAAEDPRTCAQAYEKAQEDRTAGRLNAAIEQLKSCIDSRCATFMREDCMRWMDQMESALPTVVFSVREDGQDLTNVDILCDGNLLTGTLDGKALPVDPGLHEFTFNVPGLAHMERQLLIREGERNRIVNVEFSRPHESIPPPSPLGSSNVNTVLPNPRARTNVLPYALTGVGVLGVAGFAMFGLLGNNHEGDLKSSCAPNCQSGQVDSVKTKYLLADACLGVGLVSLGVATYIFVKNHGNSASKRQQTASVGFIPRSVGVGGVLQLSASY
jgi:hypothetical protein